jgi:tRNA nucleotidyltransferase (CCA-adding enzyme)
VGGSVRDSLLGLAAKDLDLEVYGLSPEVLRTLAETEYRLDLVGQSFGVLKLRGLAIDLSIPRRESKRGLGHRGFEIHSDPEMSFRDAARRRDFTINAIGFDPLSEEILDPWEGRADLEDGVLRHVSEQFSEDPLRVLRGMQFAARFDLRVAAETLTLCRGIEREGLARERIFEEWKKLILCGRKISRGLTFLRDCGWLSHYPELAILIDCPQDPEWHPEGDVWVHTLHVMDAFVEEKVGDEWEDLVVGFACLCHDLGKPATTVFTEGRYRSPNHEALGEEPTLSFLRRLSPQEALAREVVPLVREHLKPFQLHQAKAGPAAIRRLARRTGRIDRLVRLARADQKGRPPKPFDGFPAGDWLLAKAEGLKVRQSAPKPILLGRHLIALGLQPGRHFGELLEACFAAQLAGSFSDVEGGKEFARSLLLD